ncbi:B12-binding domain-containing radical SAM protein [Desulfotalea psychrophila]|nr:cobalamin-dependent protein [Desulfotalea psychrophila]
MRILLVNPPNSGRSIPEERYGITSLKQIFRGEPLGLEVLAASLSKHEVRILDLKVVPQLLEETLELFAPDIVAFTAMTCEAQAVLQLASQVRACDERILITVGGVHASSDPEFFNREMIDWIIIGLGVQSFPLLAEALERGLLVEIDGVARSQAGKKLVYRPRSFSQDDLLTISPRYDLVHEYRPSYILETLGLQLGFVSTAAGCPFDCSFCCIGPLTGGRYFTAKIENVIRDIQRVPTPVIRLVDANTFGKPKHAEELARAIGHYGIKKQFIADVRSDTVVLHPQLMRQWREIGLRAVIIGFEEIDDSALGAMNKKNSAATNKHAIEILHDLGITIVGDFIISPDYREEQFERLDAFVQAQAIELPMYTVLTPLPGTALHREVRDQIILDDLDYYTLTNAVLPTYLDEQLFYQRYADLLAKGHRSAKV